jgi:uncharacterized protein (DUF58 family)
MSRAASPKVSAYAVLAGLGLIAALVTRRAELAALAAPFLFVLGAGFLLAADPDLSIDFRLNRDRLLEGDELEAEIDLTAQRPVERLEVLLELPPGVTLVEGRNPAAVRLSAGKPRTLHLRLRAARWGAFRVGEGEVRARDPFGLFTQTGRFDRPTAVKAFPKQESLRSLLRPAETQLFAGDELSRRKGEGTEFADLRPFVYGDRVRRINWRASARRGELWVNEQHPERNMDVVLFLDSFTEARRGAEGTLDLAVRAAGSLAERYIRRRDRVGLVAFGGMLRWLTPGSGLVQLYRIIDALLDTEITLSYAWKEIDVVPARTLPPQALVIALTPLLDDRAVRALLDLCARGFDLAVVEVSPLAFAEPGESETEQIAYRLWRLRREALRSQYLAAGVAVSEWREGTPLAASLQEVTRFRRYARLARA